jgi:hypothetical protein
MRLSLQTIAEVSGMSLVKSVRDLGTCS